MGRTKRLKVVKATEELITDTRLAIAAKEQELNSLKIQLNEYRHQLEQEKIADLVATIRNKELSLDEAKEIINNFK